MTTRNRGDGRIEIALDRLCEMMAGSDVASLPDRQLVEQYAVAHDERAFTALVRRHGAMVLGVCRRVLHHEHDAEDAFQATFLVFAKKAASIRKLDSVGSWLYGVAYRLATRARETARARQQRETHPPGPVGTASQPQEVTWREMQTVLDDELNRLPDRFRAPLLLCYLEGQTQDEAATRLGWAKGTLRRRVESGLKLLRTRLEKRGVAFSAGLLTLAIAHNAASAALTTQAVNATVRAAQAFATGTTAGAVSAQVAALADGGLHAMLMSNLKTILAITLAVGLVAGGFGLLGQHVLADLPAQAKRKEPPKTDDPLTKETVKKPTPKAGEGARPIDIEALPAGAVARLGNLHWWQGGSFYCLAFSGDNKLLACAQMDSTIRILEVPTGKEVRVLGRAQSMPTDAAGRVALPPRNTYWVSMMAFSPDRKLLAVMKHGTGVILWDIEKGEELRRIPTDLTTEIGCVAFSPDGKTLVVGGNQKAPRLWDVATGKEGHELKGHEGRAAAVAFRPDGKLVATGGDDQTVRVWDVTTGKEMRTLEGHRNAVHAVAFSPDGKHVVSAGTDQTVRVWESATGKTVHNLAVTHLNQSVGGVIGSVAVSSDGKVISLGRSDRTFRFWDFGAGRELTRFEGPAGNATNIALSPDAGIIAMGNVGQRIYLWERTTGKVLSADRGHEMQIQAVAFSPDGKVLATGSSDRVIRLWDPATGKELHQLRGHTGEVGAIAFTPDGKGLASASSSGTDRSISIWDVKTGKEERQLRGRGGVMAMAFTGNGKSLATLSQDSVLRVTEVETGKEEKSTRLQVGPMVAFSPDGKTMAAPGYDGFLKLFSVDTGAEVRKFEGKAQGYYAGGAPVFSPDGSMLLVHEYNTGLALYDVESGKLIRKLATTPRGPRAAGEDLVAPPMPGMGGMLGTPYGRLVAAFSPGGRMLAIPLADNAISLIELATGGERARLQGHVGSITALAFSPDGIRVATGSADTTAMIWDVRKVGGAKKSAPPAAAWEDLKDSDPARGFEAVLGLVASGADGVSFLDKNLKPQPPVPADRIDSLIKDLDSNEFAKRKKAAQDLESLGETAKAALKKTLEGKPSLDLSRRIEGILETLETRTLSADGLREVRAVEALEWIGSKEARAVLEKLAKGGSGRLTTEAAAALARLQKR